MQRKFTAIAEAFSKKNHQRCIWKKAVSIMACAVVFCTTYALILPAITMERETVCGMEEHLHDASCYEQLAESTQAMSELTCQIPESETHIHTEQCYGTWELTCTLPEHTHTDACKPAKETAKAPAEAPAEGRVAQSIAMIDALPTAEEVAQRLAAYEENGDEAGYLAYFEEVALQAKSAYVYYEDMGTALQKEVTNAEKMLNLTWLWEAEPLANTKEQTVYQVNKYTEAKTTLVYGGSVQNKLGTGMKFTNWDVIFVEKGADGHLYIDKYEKKGNPKLSYKASTADGFILLLYKTTVDVKVGDLVTVDFDYKNKSGYTASGHGKVMFHKVDNPEIVQGADTRNLIEVNLYDYGTNINELHNKNSKYPGFQQDGGQKSVSDTGTGESNFGNNITEDLAAGKSGLTNKGGAINNITNSANSPISGAMRKTLGSDGYPALADGTSLKYLFSDNTYATKKNKQSINGLFQQDTTTGAYTFNSRENHAQFNPSDDTFTLYDKIISSNFMWYPFGNFLPFNDILNQSAQASTIDRVYLQDMVKNAKAKYAAGKGDEYNTLATALNKWITLMDEKYPNGWGANEATKAYFETGPGKNNPSFDYTSVYNQLQNVYSIDFDEATDFYFGMEMKMNFIQPKDGLTGNDGQQPMVFYFTGDDDVWVYIDGVLFLDLSGIHRHVGGEIDFVNGVVKYYNLDVSTGDVATTPYKTQTFAEILDSTAGLNENGTFADYSSHKFNFYYMERGAGSGVCRMNFNFPLLHKNSISVTKELSVDEGNSALLGNPDFKFQVLKENSTDLFIGAGTAYDILGTAGNKISSGTTDANGVFTLKVGQTAVFKDIPENAGKYFVRELLDENAFGQYGSIAVDGSSQTKNYDVTVGSDTFKGVDSPVKDISDGATIFRFNNKVTVQKLGSLSIEKVLTEYSPPTREAKQFTFDVTLDGVPLPVGTTYTVGNETRTVTEAGKITLAAGEKAVISNILAGSTFTVKETETSAEGYNVSYTVDGQTVDSVSGTIRTETAVAITVTNSESGTSVDIPIQKNLQYPDGLKHTYTFKLEQVTDSSGNKLVENGVTQTAEITVTDTAKGKFTIGYPQVGLGELPQKFYYKITEVPDTDKAVETIYDNAIYIVEVTVDKDADGNLTAVVTQVWKNGTEVAETATDATYLTFTNQIVRYELPETGGSGTGMYTLCGTALMAAAVGYGLVQRRKRERGRE